MILLSERLEEELNFYITAPFCFYFDVAPSVPEPLDDNDASRLIGYYIERMKGHTTSLRHVEQQVFTLHERAKGFSTRGETPAERDKLQAV